MPDTLRDPGKALLGFTPPLPKGIGGGGAAGAVVEGAGGGGGGGARDRKSVV